MRKHVTAMLMTSLAHDGDLRITRKSGSQRSADAPIGYTLLDMFRLVADETVTFCF